MSLLFFSLSLSNCRRRGGDVEQPSTDGRVAIQTSDQGNEDVVRNSSGFEDKENEASESSSDSGDGQGNEDSFEASTDSSSSSGDINQDSLSEEINEEEGSTVGEGDAKVDLIDIKFDGKSLYRASDAKMDKAILDADDGSLAETALKYIYSVPIAVWVDGTNVSPEAEVARVTKIADDQGRRLVMVIHSVPKRNCTINSDEVANGQAYEAWIESFIKGVEDREAIIILEPNALGKADNCANIDAAYSLQEMLDHVGMAVDKLTAVPTLDVYLDMGFWVVPARAVELIDAVDPSKKLSGMIINDSDYRSNAEMMSFCENTNTAFNGTRTLPCIIDTGRNGQPPAVNMEWCNAPGRGLGILPGDVSSGLLKGYLWVRNPAESDGECEREEPAAREIFTERAIELYEKRYQE